LGSWGAGELASWRIAKSGVQRAEGRERRERKSLKRVARSSNWNIPRKAYAK